MFLKNALEEKLKRSLSEYNSTEEKRFIYKKRNQNFVIHQKNEKLNFPLDHKKFNDEDVSKKVSMI
jgi:hypothetical protein